MSTKLLERAEVKATVTDTDQRVLDFYMLTFSDRPDKQGDMIDRTAADEWLDAFYKGGFPLPISFTHAAVRDSTDPFAIIGYAPADAGHVFKDDKGIRVIAFLDTGTNETAQQVYTLVKRGIINGASVAYVAEKEKRNRDGSILIQKMTILEAGPCLDPANPDASVMSVKTAEELTDAMTFVVGAGVDTRSVNVTLPFAEYEAISEKAGKKISSASRASIEQAIETLRSLIEDVQSEAEGKANEEDPEGGNSEEPSLNEDLRLAMAAEVEWLSKVKEQANGRSTATDA